MTLSCAIVSFVRKLYDSKLCELRVIKLCDRKLYYSELCDSFVIVNYMIVVCVKYVMIKLCDSKVF